MRMTALTFVVALLVGCSGQQPEQESAAPPTAPEPGWHRPPLRSDPTPRVLQRYDQNGNGQLDPTEREVLHKSIESRFQEDRQTLIVKYDLDRNGVLDAAEMKAALSDREAVRKVARSYALKKFDTNGNGILDEDEKVKMREAEGRFLSEATSRALSRWDSNHNGRLDPEEWDAMNASLKKSTPATH